VDSQSSRTVNDKSVLPLSPQLAPRFIPSGRPLCNRTPIFFGIFKSRTEDIFWCGYVSILWIRLNLVDTSQSCLNLLCIARRLTYAWVIYISSFLSTGTSCRQSMLSAKYISFLFLVYVHGNFAHDHHVLSSIVRPFCVLLFIVFTLSCIVFSAYSRPLWAASYFDKDTERVLLGVSRFIEIFGLPN